jgi:hypothetical protein
MILSKGGPTRRLPPGQAPEMRSYTAVGRLPNCLIIRKCEMMARVIVGNS